jgi:hypothetical protein
MSDNKDKQAQSSQPNADTAKTPSDEQYRRTQALKRMIESLQALDGDNNTNSDANKAMPVVQDKPPHVSSSDDVSDDLADVAEHVSDGISAEITNDVVDDAIDDTVDDAVDDEDAKIDTAVSGVHDSIADDKTEQPTNTEDDDIIHEDDEQDALDGLVGNVVSQDSQSILPIDVTPNQPKIVDSQAIQTRQDGLANTEIPAPWTLQQFFNGEIDLDVELTHRFPSMPMMSIIKFRTLGERHGRNVATLRSQDGSATVIIDADKTTKTVLFSFTIGSMLTLRFSLSDLSDMDRNRWVELMRREQGGLAFLWGSARWAQDYMICIGRKYHTNLYAFSPNNFEAAVRLTPDVTRKLLDWLNEMWQEDASDEEPPQMLTW